MLTQDRRFAFGACNLWLGVLIVLAAGTAHGAESSSDAFTKTQVDIWSDGTRISGDLFIPAGVKDGDKLPAILLSHGWGGTRSHLSRAYAPRFAAAGYIALAIDYRGWGDSDSRLVIVGDVPEPDENGHATVEVQVIREVVDPVDQLRDIRSALDYLEGVPNVDAGSIGIWGSSYSGGHVVWTAGNDSRIKAAVAQVGAMDSELVMARAYEAQGGTDYLHAQAIKRARGELPPVPQGQPLPGLRGTPILERVGVYRPIASAGNINAAILFLDVELEELFNPDENGKAVYDLIKDRTDAHYYRFEGITHYQIYSGEPYEQAVKMAIEWYDTHLKNVGSE